MNDLARDIRFAFRSLLHAPGFAAAAVVALGLGTGATTAVFSLRDGVVLRPLPYPDPDRLVMLWGTNDERGLTHERLSPVNLMDYRELEADTAGKRIASPAAAVGNCPGFTPASAQWNLPESVPLFEALDFALGIVASLAVALLNGAYELVAAALDPVEVVIGQVAPLLLDLALDLVPLALEGRLVHAGLLPK